MKQCLNERVLLRVHTREGTLAEREHLRLCADCAERYDQLAEDLDVLRHILQEPPPAAAVRRVEPFRVGWVPLAAAAALVVALASASLLHQPASVPVQLAARSTTVSAFATDVSAALFADSIPTTIAALTTSDASYLQAALDAGSLCTPDRYDSGECDDQLSALLLEANE